MNNLELTDDELDAVATLAEDQYERIEDNKENNEDARIWWSDVKHFELLDSLTDKLNKLFTKMKERQLKEKKAFVSAKIGKLVTVNNPVTEKKEAYVMEGFLKGDENIAVLLCPYQWYIKKLFVTFSINYIEVE